MDLSMYRAVWKQERDFFWVVSAGIFLVCLAWFLLQPVRYQGTLLLNVGRSGIKETTDYTYDSFYRLQADERFADTLVRWLANPRVASDVLESAGMSSGSYTEKTLAGQFAAKRLSSQVVEVRFIADEPKTLEKYAEAITKVTQEYTASLGTDAGWFRVVGSKPVVRDARVPALPFLPAAAAVALFLGFWAALVRNFFRGQDNLFTYTKERQ